MYTYIVQKTKKIEIVFPPILESQIFKTTYTQQHTCIDKYTHTCIHTYMYTYIHTYMYTYIHTYMYTCIHTYIHTHMYT